MTAEPAQQEADPPDAGDLDGHDITVHLDDLLAARGMTLVELSARVGVTVANLSVLKNGRARAIRFTTLTALCRALDCTPGELLARRPQETDRGPAGRGQAVEAEPTSGSQDGLRQG